MDYYSEIQMNKKQAKIFAQAIFADISKYAKEHEKEYENFLTENNYIQSVNGKENENENEHSKSA